MSAGGALAHRFGVDGSCRSARSSSARALCGCSTPRPRPRSAVALIAAGFLGGVVDVTMNAEGARIERRLGRPILARLHAAASAGMAIGAILGSLIAAGRRPGRPGSRRAGARRRRRRLRSRGAERPSRPAPVGASGRSGLSFAPALIGLGIVIGVSIAAETAASLWSTLLLRAGGAEAGGDRRPRRGVLFRLPGDAALQRRRHPASDQRPAHHRRIVRDRRRRLRPGRRSGRFRRERRRLRPDRRRHRRDRSVRLRACGAPVGSRTGGRARLGLAVQRADPSAGAAGDRRDRPDAVASDRLRRLRGRACGRGRRRGRVRLLRRGARSPRKA